ncbi:CHAT domain-containing protein [Nostoc sp. CALU 546]|uniref:CHAT domain-containing protein n=1 Tax=Nostoc sp. CALU 546 TaxID=1867241 RepID=UPI003B6781DC
MGLVYERQGQYNKAFEAYQQALIISKRIGDKLGIAITLNNIGTAYLTQNKYYQAEANLFASIENWETLRNGLVDNDKISIFEQQEYSYRFLQQALTAQNKTDQALEISERGRARAFVELIASRLTTTSNSKMKPPTIEEIKKIAKIQNATIVQYSIPYYNFKVAGKQQFKESELYIWVIKPTGEISFRPSDLKSVWQKQNISLRDKIAQARQSIIKGVNVASRGNNITFTPGDRVKLNDDDPDWEAWQVISVDIKNGKITIRLPSWEAEKPAIERPIADVAKKTSINSSGANAKNLQLQELYQLLIQPIADILPKEETARVIFIPQDALFLVPFPALQDSSGQYLIDKHTILTAPSIQVLESTHKLRQKVPGSAKDILIVGNPTMPKVSKKPGELPQQLGALPGSEKEALAIASFWKTQALIGNQATKKAVLGKLPLAKIIHLATHGLLDDIQGLGSSIVFAPEDQDNGLLTAEEILNLYTPTQGSTLSAELVVLSACDTGQGRLTGDGVIGLSRSIIAAGVPSVIVSLWSIPDAPTAELMTEFYENFRKDPDKATALRQAMLTTKKKHPNPADWAAFTLIGESE